MRQGVMKNSHTYPILSHLIFYLFFIRTRMRTTLYEYDRVGKGVTHPQSPCCHP